MHPRRQFLALCAASIIGMSVPARWARALKPAERRLGFYNLHTGETLSAAYWLEGSYMQSPCADFDQLLRDHRSGEVHLIDRSLFDLLYSLQGLVGVGGPFHVISGYRSPATNAMLHAKSRGVAARSLHTFGRAIDIRLPGCKLENLRAAALQLKRGGVGYYPAADFIHVDTGRVRFW